jgi:hypothetical protein
MLSEVSRLLKITIVGGSIPERSGDRVYNTCCVFGTDGKLKAKHRKVLFETQLTCCMLPICQCCCGKYGFNNSLILGVMIGQRKFKFNYYPNTFRHWWA